MILGWLALLLWLFWPRRPKPIFRFEAGNITGLKDGDPIEILPDSSGNEYHAVQPDPKKRPIYRTR